MTETQLRKKVVAIAQGFQGCKESDGSHQKIIDIYNAHKPLARNYKVKATDEWCATTVSAVFIRAGLTAIAPTECSCEKMIELYRKIGRWQENDGYKPKIGDIIMYDWQDSGAGDNKGWSDHTGIVTGISGSTITVLEGNKNQAVGIRKMQVGGKYIRGYCLPAYEKKAASAAPAPAKGGAKTVTIKLPVIKSGSRSASVTALQQLLTAKGYSTKGADGICGNNTISALKKYQKAKKLTVDGECGQNTWTALLTK